MTDGKETPVAPDHDLTALEQDFNTVMEAMSEDDSLDHFRVEFEKMFTAFRRSHFSEQKLAKKCQDLTQDLLGNAAKMQAAVKLAQGDHSTIEALKKEIEKAWKMVDTANDKDFQARETVKTLMEEVKSLQNILEEGSRIPSDYATIDELKLENKRLQIEVDELTKTAETLSRETSETMAAQKKVEADLRINTEDAQKIADRFELVKQEHRREKNAKERANFQCEELVFLLRMRENELAMKNNAIHKLDAAIMNLRTHIRESNEKKQALIRKIDTAEKQLYHTQQSIADSVDTTSELMERLMELDQEARKKEGAITSVREEIQRVERVRDRDFKEVVRITQVNDNIRQDKANLIQQKIQLEHRINTLNREKKDLLESLGMVHREKEILQKQGLKEDKRRQVVEKMLKNEELNLADLRESIEREKEISIRLKNSLLKLEKEREMCRTEVSQVNRQQVSAEEELKMAIAFCEETQKCIEESEAKLSQQQKRYELVRTERNQFSKKLVEAQDEIVELKQRFKILDHQIAQFKEDLHIKGKRYVEESSKRKMAITRLGKARRLVNEYGAQFEKAKMESEAVSLKIRQLIKIVSNCDKELSAQRQRFLKMSNERDLLGSQLIRRNDELALLYDKLRIHQETQSTGEEAYRLRIDDLRLLRNKIRELRRQSLLAINRSKEVYPLKKRLRALEYDIAAEQSKVAALSEELESPQNAQRWRPVEGKDPTAEELAKKSADLQKRLVSKSEEALEKELIYQEKERLVTELEAIIARQPHPEIAQHLNLYHKDLLRKNAKMKQAASELNMTTTHIAELKYEAQRLRHELQRTKRAYYELKVKSDMVINPPLSALLPCLNSSFQGSSSKRDSKTLGSSDGSPTGNFTNSSSVSLPVLPQLAPKHDGKSVR